MHILRLTGALLIVIFAAASVEADDCQCQARCPRCNVVCVPSTEIEKEKKTAFDVDCKWICVPRVRFPWEPCCKPKCAYVRKVHVLKKIDYHCEKCKYKWTATCKCNCSSCSSVAGASHGSIAPPPVPKATESPVRLPRFDYFDEPQASEKPVVERTTADNSIIRFFDNLRKR